MGVTLILIPIVSGIVVIILALVSFALWRVVKKTSQINPVVPKMLQFHEDQHDCDNISNGLNVETTKNDGNLDNSNENTGGPPITQFQSARFSI